MRSRPMRLTLRGINASEIEPQVLGLLPHRCLLLWEVISSPGSKGLLRGWRWPWKIWVRLQKELSTVMMRGRIPLPRTPPTIPEACTSQTSWEKLPTVTGDSMSGWLKLLKLTRRNERNASFVKALIISSEIAQLQKMAGGPCSRGGLPKTIRPLQRQRRGYHPLCQECRSGWLNLRSLNQTLRENKEGNPKGDPSEPGPF